MRKSVFIYLNRVPVQPALIIKISAMYVCSWHKTKSHNCLHCQSFVEWLNLEGIGDTNLKKQIFVVHQFSGVKPIDKSNS
jgi:hypothetical protein